MNKQDIVKAAYTLDNPKKSAEFLSDSFQGTDEVGSPPFDKSGWIRMGEVLKSALPDIKVNIEDIREEGDKVLVTSYFSGTFKNDLDLSDFGMGIIPATGAAVKFPSSTNQISFNGEKILKSHNTDSGPDGGFPGLLKALGVSAG